MKLKKFKSLFRGVAATTATLLALSSVGYTIAKSPLALGWVDGFFGINSRDIYKDVTTTYDPTTSGDSDVSFKAYEKEYSKWSDFVDAFKAHGQKQGEEGFALMKNDNAALPLNANHKVVLFGWNAYHTPSGHTGVVAGNSDAITLETGLKNAGVELNETVTIADFELGETTNSKGQTSFANAMKSASANYTIPEMFEENEDWVINKASSTAIVAVGRGGGEGANYITDDATNAEDPLALSDAELEMIDYAREHCSKVIVLVVSANAMELGPISKGGAHEVDAIGFCGIPNDYQYGGIAKVLAGKANATGAMPDTYVYDNSYTPAVINMGEQQYSDVELIADVTARPDALGRGEGTGYLGDNYIVQAEGIYVGYKYYESRYYDSIVNPTYNASATVGSTSGEAWDYSNEVLYTFGHGLSYIPYSQEVTQVGWSLSEYGNVEATIEVTNEGDEDGYFLAQLYVQRPYTQYDIDNKIEKSAVDFLNSAKVHVAAGATEEVKITVPTKYLASWDSNGAGTYVLDEGDYYFTAASGAHEAVNNILEAQGYETDGTTNGSGKAEIQILAEFDDTTFATSTMSGETVEVTNQADDGVDINYWLPGKVTYLSRSDWEGTFPKNYTNYENNSGIAPEAAFKLADSDKLDEWINALRNIQYVPKTNGNVTNVEGIRPEGIGANQSVWEWIMSFATTDTEAFLDIKSEQWQAVAQAINLNEAVGNILHGGNTTDSLVSIGNPISRQSESVAGYQQTITIDGIQMKLAIASNTLLGSSFNPALAYEWGKLEGDSGLWAAEASDGSIPVYTVWGGGLNQHRHAYNGRNSEYMSEDPMLTNRLGYEQYRGAVEKGAINGPKHMGFNDQELNRQGNACYMTEQKMRETDIRCYQGALSDAHATGVMMSFARVGAINVTNHIGLMKNIMRGEWGFTGIITTDMGQKGYHEPYSIIMATCNQYAGFGANDSFIGDGPTDFSDEAADKTWSYVTMGALKKDPVLAEQARQTTLYQLYTLAHSSAGGVRVIRGEKPTGPITITRPTKVGEIKVAGWEYIFISLIAVTALLTVGAGVGFGASILTSGKEE